MRGFQFNNQTTTVYMSVVAPHGDVYTNHRQLSGQSIQHLALASAAIGKWCVEARIRTGKVTAPTH